MGMDPRVQEILQVLHTVKGIRHEHQERQNWCFPASVKSVAGKYGIDVHQADIARDVGLDDGGTTCLHIPITLYLLGLESRMYEHPTLDIVASHIDRDEPLIAVYSNAPSAQEIACAGDPAVTPHASGHTIVIAGYAERRGIAVFDPLEDGPQLRYDERHEQEWSRIARLYAVWKKQ